MPRFTDRELDIMNVLWQHGPATVAEVRERLDDEGRSFQWLMARLVNQWLDSPKEQQP